MTETRPQRESDAAMPTASKVLCAAYAVIAVVALVATWSQNLAYAGGPGGAAALLSTFWSDTKANPASRSITVDIALFLLAAAVFMVTEARKHGVRFVWAYIAGGFLVAISVTFPLFMIARERRICRTQPTSLGAVDVALLADVALGVAAFTFWVDVL